jgi:TM2 domain-containing membrane protein YozV/cold shock CspA family protein
MRGIVLGFDTATGKGVISGDDANRYNVDRAGLGDGVHSLMPGKKVDFVVDGASATSVFPIQGDFSLGEKNKWMAALLAFVFGGLGVHKFYLGKRTAGFIMLATFLGGIILAGIPTFIITIVGFIECVIYIVKSEQQFYDDYVVGDRAWF